MRSRSVIRELDALAGRSRPSTSCLTKNERLQRLIVEVLAANGKGTTIEEILKGAMSRGYRSWAKAATQRIVTKRVLSGLARSGVIRRVGRWAYAARA